MKIYRVHEIVNYFYPSEIYSNGNDKVKAIKYGQRMHEKIQERMKKLNENMQCEYILNYNYKNKAIIQGHVDVFYEKEKEIIIYEIKPVVSWLKVGYKYDMQLNIYIYLAKKLFAKNVKAYYLLYYKGTYRKIPFLSRFSDKRIEEFIDEFLKNN